MYGDFHGAGLGYLDGLYHPPYHSGMGLTGMGHTMGSYGGYGGLGSARLRGVNSCRNNGLHGYRYGSTGIYA